MVKRKINPDDIDANFVIQSFKNKDRRNNPSSEPRPLYPPSQQPQAAVATAQVSEQAALPVVESESVPSVVPEQLSTTTSQKQEQPSAVHTESPREDTKRKRSRSPDFESQFLVNVPIPARKGKLVAIREKYHERITKIVRVIGGNEISIFSYIDNILSHHFDAYQDDIAELYNKRNQDDYLNRKK